MNHTEKFFEDYIFLGENKIRDNFEKKSIKEENLTNKECAKKIKELERIINLLKYDSLTGFYSRTYFDKILKNEIIHKLRKSSKRLVLLLLIDIDNLKYVNENFSYIEGDNYIKESALRIKNVLKPYEHYVIRNGGDEFLVIVFLENGNMDTIKKIEEGIEYKKKYKGLSVGYLVLDKETFIESSFDKLIKELQKFMKIKKLRKPFFYREKNSFSNSNNSLK